MAKNKTLFISAIVIITLTVATAFFIFNHPESEADEQSTDDAYVQADFTVVAPQISGVINQISVEENQPVRKGSALVHIDDRDLRIAVEVAKAACDSLEAQLERQHSAIVQARAGVVASLASLKLADANRNRFANLARDGSGTIQAKQQAEAEWRIKQAALESDKAVLLGAEQQVVILKAELEKARAVKDDADLKLSYADIISPISGIVAQRSAKLGNYIRTGEPVLTLVPLDAIYIEANFRETQWSRIRPGQKVDIKVDALPSIKLKGYVASLGPASGVSFSTIPPHNATGNFTKIVQRLPVRIQLEPGQADARSLRVGMSVQTKVNVKIKSVERSGLSQNR
jgi:membrane fusion protein (multidrug efflux system)